MNVRRVERRLMKSVIGHPKEARATPGPRLGPGLGVCPRIALPMSFGTHINSKFLKNVNFENKNNDVVESFE